MLPKSTHFLQKSEQTQTHSPFLQKNEQKQTQTLSSDPNLSQLSTYSSNSILDSNSFYNDLHHFMALDKNRDFIDKYFNTNNSGETIMIFTNLYSFLHKKNIDTNLIIPIIHTAMTDITLCRKIIELSKSKYGLQNELNKHLFISDHTLSLFPPLHKK